MRIVIDLQAAQTDSRMRGIGRQARALAFALIEKARHHDLVFILNAGLTEGLDALRSELVDLLPVDSVRLFNIPGSVREIEPANLWRMRAAEIARETFIAGLRPDVVHLTSLFEGMIDDAVTSIGVLQAPYPTAATLFDLIPLQDPQRYLPTQELQQFYYRRLQSLKRADRLIAISGHARQDAIDLLSVSPDIVDVAPLAADGKFHPIKLSRDEIRTLQTRYRLPDCFILYIGAVESRKNLGVLVRAFAKLTPEVRSSHYVVVGGRFEEDYRRELVSIAGACGLSPDRLVFTGHIADNDLVALYCLSRLFVFPSEREGFGLPPLEAMACGVPVLVARNSSLIEVVGRNDMTFATHDPNELVSRMTRVLHDQQYAKALSDWGLRQASRFSWVAHAEAVLGSLECMSARHVKSPQLPGNLIGRRPRLAFVTPLPPAQSGVADYALELLPELARQYDIECIVDTAASSCAWIDANYPIREVTYFRDNSGRYDRVLYAMGNSLYHAYMIDLIEDIPGVVILHDFFLSGLHYWMSNVGERSRNAFVDELYLTHGLPALTYLAQFGRQSAMMHFPVNRSVFDYALGIIIHSQWGVDRAKEIYGHQIGDLITLLPLLKTRLPQRGKAAARDRLGILTSAFVVCSFGIVADTKLSEMIVAAWSRCEAGGLLHAELVFVGERPGKGRYCTTLDETIARAGMKVKIHFTGYVSNEVYQDYLFAADLAIQLRTNSRGETSKAILDCMAASLPLIVNAHGPAAEIPSEAALVLPDRCTSLEVAIAIDALQEDSTRRERMATAGKAWVDDIHSPNRVSLDLMCAVETYSTTGVRAMQRPALAAIANIGIPGIPQQHDIVLLADALTRNTPRDGLRRLLFDITLLAERDAHTGIERVVRAVLAEFIKVVPSGYRIEPVRIDQGELRFARGFLSDVLNLASMDLGDSPVDYDRGDVYIAMEWAADRLPGLADWLTAFRAAGGEVVIAVHDLLPLDCPGFFPATIEPIARQWFSTVLDVATRLICFSRTVADDVVVRGKATRNPSLPELPVSYVPLAADIENSFPTRGLPEDADRLVELFKSRPMFLMVGTVEPRKGHEQVITAFRELWDSGLDVVLVIVGRRGWSVDLVNDLVVTSAELGRRLFWFDDASDEWLTKLYDAAHAVIAASYAEGFGLPLIEASLHGTPLIARDIPIFREVAGDASFFKGDTVGGLAVTVMQWLAEHGDARKSPNSRVLSRRWSDVAREIGAAITAGVTYRAIGGPRAKNSA